MRLLSAQAAVSLENAQLYEQVDNYSRTLEQQVTRTLELQANEHQLKAFLAQKEVLLKEVHHRVKNNLQVISSLLRLQAGYIQDPQASQMFQVSQDRVRAMFINGQGQWNWIAIIRLTEH